MMKRFVEFSFQIMVKNIYVYDLQGQNNKGKYKGAGCELVKVAVNESIKSGYKGKLNACMADSLPFYFKK